MKKIIKVTDLTELKKLYDNCAYVVENYGARNPEELLNVYGEEGAVGYTFTADLLYQVCHLPESSTLPRDRKYLAIISPKEMYKDTMLETITSRIYQISFTTGYNEFAAKEIHHKEAE